MAEIELRRETQTGLIPTFSGRGFRPLEPREYPICIQDIAHSLSMQCRFIGHSRRFYSVAEHCVWVSCLCDKGDAMAGLLHDAPEAYLGRQSDAIKQTSHLGDAYRFIENELSKAIAEKFGLPSLKPASVRFADKAMLHIESLELINGPVQDHDQLVKYRAKIPIKPECWPPSLAEQEFMNRFHSLLVETQTV